jgi:hypothetical protein
LHWIICSHEWRWNSALLATQIVVYERLPVHIDLANFIL